jgi:uncharacterized protein (TIGR01244 family)
MRTTTQQSRVVTILVFLVIGLATTPGSGQVIRQEVPGIRNFAQVESTVACSGAITPESVAGIRDMGFRSIINLRLATEQGANVEVEEQAASEAGINYFHLPFSSGSPDASVVDSFVEVISDDANSPAFIHCAGGSRAAGMWFVKRAVVDGWDTDRAMAEANALGLSSDGLRSFLTGYVEAQRP